VNSLSLKGYLPLNDYSAKYRISLSTLRRRIRAGDIEYRFELGKYWLAELPPTRYGQVVAEQSVAQVATPVVAAAAVPVTATVAVNPSTPQKPPENLLDSAQKMVQELKSAYVSVLHEKEEQIMQLKEEMTDLKTLVKVLESETERLRINARESAPIDSWLEENT
jgi:hypothetical protein